MKILRAKARCWFVDRVLWCVVGMIGAVVLDMMILDLRHDFALNRVGLGVALSLTTLAVLGVCLRWGPVIPCVFLGVLASTLVASENAISHEAATLGDVVAMVIGAGCGGVVGVVLVARRWVRSGAEQQDGSGERLIRGAYGSE